ncbi:hypothetical protein, partial [Amaricoccus sp.]|uniref:hypothetical protein n=1 Tax=Amaricoccus sp. TaxID=1872485 RepID=UPI001B5BA164
SHPTIAEDRAMTTASPPACQRDGPRRQAATLPANYTTTGDTTLCRGSSDQVEGDVLDGSEVA